MHLKMNLLLVIVLSLFNLATSCLYLEGLAIYDYTFESCDLVPKELRTFKENENQILSIDRLKPRNCGVFKEYQIINKAIANSYGGEFGLSLDKGSCTFSILKEVSCNINQSCSDEARNAAPSSNKEILELALQPGILDTRFDMKIRWIEKNKIQDFCGL